MKEVPYEEKQKVTHNRKINVLHEFEQEVVIEYQVNTEILVSFDEIFCQFSNMIHIDGTFVFQKNCV